MDKTLLRGSFPVRHKIVRFSSILTLILLGVLARLIVAQHDSVWLDELHTAWATNGSFWSVWNRCELGNQTPLYFWLVWPIIDFWGSSALRWLSILLGVTLIVISCCLIWKWTRSSAASLLVTFLIAFDPWFIYYSTEARPYVLLELLSLIQVVLFLRLYSAVFDKNRKPMAATTSIVGFVITSSALLYCHYTGIFLLLSEMIFLLGLVAYQKRTRWQLLKISCWVTLGTLACCSPLIWHSLEVYQRREHWESVSSIHVLLSDIARPVLAQLVLPIVCLTGILCFQKFQGNRRTPSPIRQPVSATSCESTKYRFSFLIVWAVVPIVSVLALEITQLAPMALYRYTQIGAVAIPLFAALCTAAIPTKFGRFCVAIVIIFASLGLPLQQRGLSPYFRAENWNEPIEVINARLDKQTQPVFLFSNLIEDIAAYQDSRADFQAYLRFPINGLNSIETQQRITIAGPTWATKRFRDQDLKLIEEQGGAWILIRGTPELVNAIRHDLILQFDDPPPITIFQSPNSCVYLLSID